MAIACCLIRNAFSGGCWLSERGRLLDTEIPYVRLCERPWRSLKTRSSERDVPLVGAALWAAQRAYESSPNEYLFPRYCSEQRCKADYASNTLNKWLRVRLSDNYVLLGFRHSLRDRLRYAECPREIVDQIGGWAAATVRSTIWEGLPTFRSSRMASENLT